MQAVNHLNPTLAHCPGVCCADTMGQTSPRGMPQISPRAMTQTMSAFKPAAAMATASAVAAVSGNAVNMPSPRGNAGSTDYNSTMNGTMTSTIPRDSRAKFLKWFNTLSPRQGQVEESQLLQLESSRQVFSKPMLRLTGCCHLTV